MEPAGRKINLTQALSWAGVDVSEQVNMELSPRCQLSQSGFSHYLTLPPRERGKGQEGILLLNAQGIASLGGPGWLKSRDRASRGGSCP